MLPSATLLRHEELMPKESKLLSALLPAFAVPANNRHKSELHAVRKTSQCRNWTEDSCPMHPFALLTPLPYP